MVEIDKWKAHMVVDLRFNTQSAKGARVTYASYKSIADVLNMTYNQVQHICRRAFKGLPLLLRYLSKHSYIFFRVKRKKASHMLDD